MCQLELVSTRAQLLPRWPWSIESRVPFNCVVNSGVAVLMKKKNITALQCVARPRR